MARTFSVGTDIGGTFTDMVVVDDQSNVALFKLPTTPEDRSLGVLHGFEAAARANDMTVAEFTAAVRYFAHGTTAATNALIERKGEVTGLLTTRGAGDTLLIQRSMGSWTGAGDLSGHYSRRRNPVPLVQRTHIREIDQRHDFAGEAIVALDRDGVRAAVRQLRDAGVRSMAICFLWSFVNPEHELAAAEIIRQEWPDVFVTTSSDVAPVIGEYERTATTIVNSYLGPVISRYVELLESRLRDAGFTGDFTVMDSAGGVMDARQAGRRAVEMLTSGPAGGVLASAALAARLGYRNVITGDMGGTSFDVGLIVDGEPLTATSSIEGRYHLAVPKIRVTAIGAGGGSIAGVDSDGILTVGPESAGAVPGPACYGKGGTRPTVTDADVVLGVIDPANFLGGAFPLYRNLAEEAIAKHVAEPLNMTVPEAAAGIRKVADNQMADLVRSATVQEGHDPRDFALFAYGGAGPTHAYAYAPEADISTVVIPYTATVHSAYGAVSSDQYRSVQLSDPQRTPPMIRVPSEHIDLDRINDRFAELERRCRTELRDDPAITTNRLLYFRYRRQVHELPIGVPPGPLTAERFDELAADFHRRYERLYGEGTSLPEGGIEINTFRVEGRIPSPTAHGSSSSAQQADTLEGALLGRRAVTFDGVALDTAVYRGEALPSQIRITGPAVLEYFGTTAVVAPGQSAVADHEGNVVITTRTVNGAH
ncbi:hydantoinase/oxoprolinase family protein [Paractinoplanes toevensis]|uniref:5-oxoprolinase n=1 Tax=Paractinoplanes toevensis TaxID=571911 RepID=A0A919T6L5_9ACTN|nr:hydantoinase/oxoprolinase family protein [Actinoplanes toevensis]GIM89985.1 5-oxoprolinase [Actinoplanes toevensis]